MVSGPSNENSLAVKFTMFGVAAVAAGAGAGAAVVAAESAGAFSVFAQPASTNTVGESGRPEQECGRTIHGMRSSSKEWRMDRSV